MPKQTIANIIKKHGRWRIINTAIAAATIVTAIVFILELIMPVTIDTLESGAIDRNDVPPKHRLSSILQHQPDANDVLAKMKRSGLFKPSMPLPDKPMADKTIERIKSQLALQCIMQMNKQPVAYINIKGIGLRQCKVGESIRDLFTVMNINKDTVEITIVGHKVVLSL